MHNTDVYILCNILHFNVLNIIFVKDSKEFYSLGGSWCQKFEVMTLCHWLLNLKTSKLWHGVEDCYCAKFQVIPIGIFFCFIMLIYTPTHTYPYTDTHTHIVTKWSQYLCRWSSMAVRIYSSGFSDICVLCSVVHCSLDENCCRIN